MNRELDETEKALTEKGLNRVQSEKEKYQKALDKTIYHKTFLGIKRAYEDYMRPFTRENEDTDLDNTIKGYESELKMAEEKIALLQDQLTNGVAIKEVLGTG